MADKEEKLIIPEIAKSLNNVKSSDIISYLQSQGYDIKEKAYSTKISKNSIWYKKIMEHFSSKNDKERNISSKKNHSLKNQRKVESEINKEDSTSNILLKNEEFQKNDFVEDKSIIENDITLENKEKDNTIINFKEKIKNSLKLLKEEFSNKLNLRERLNIIKEKSKLNNLINKNKEIKDLLSSLYKDDNKNIIKEKNKIKVLITEQKFIKKDKEEKKESTTQLDPSKNKKVATKKSGKDKDFKKKQLEEEEKLLAKANINKKKKKENKKIENENQEPLSMEVKIYDGMNVKEIAEKIRVSEAEIIKKLFMQGKMVTVNQSLDKETIIKIISDYGFSIKEEEESKEDELLELKVEEISQDESLLEVRPPVVTIMGHVDHGKTSLLDCIRKSNVAEKEAGGITQHIGAYQVSVNDRLITFLDTPGHEAFTALRARGARATDIAVLVVAADDGVMPQTIEAINHAKAASVPIIVAINKIDKADANPDKIKQQLSDYNLIPEEWGGNTVMVPVSAKNKIGINDLLEMILLTADLQEFKANPNKMSQGVIIESKLDKGKGPVATVLVQAGTLKIGDNFVVGSVYGKVRAMFNYLGKPIKEAKPSTPVQVIGFSSVPVAGEIFKVVSSDKEAKELAEKVLLEEKEKQALALKTVKLESLSEQIGQGKVKELSLIIKTDVQGSAEALTQSLSKISVEDVNLKILHCAVGDVNENDVNLAVASSAIIIAFNVKVDSKAKDLAEKENIDIRTYNIIYRVIEDIEKALKGLLEPEVEEVYSGKAEVRAIFTIGKVNVVAGCYVLDGKITRNSIIEVIRNGKVIHKGKVESLKRFKDDVREVNAGFECGISLEKFNDILEKDILQAYILKEKKLE
ncbi:MAG: hypothetical protein KatS3mg068_0377 [Candidatus Sericytochromatia bacterium]|nr:MAG: hypothetical protein KatS3mg068_0377 [Candidatus Sericytochromatia bacterium]